MNGMACSSNRSRSSGDAPSAASSRASVGGAADSWSSGAGISLGIAAKLSSRAGERKVEIGSSVSVIRPPIVCQQQPIPLTTMLISKYSNPDFDPYQGEALVEPDDGPWTAPTATAPLSATVSIPGSKSLTNRELVLSALADGPSVLRRPLHSRDSALMIDALRGLGTVIEEGEPGPFGPDVVITPGELSGGASVDCGLAGTVMRFIPPVAALALGPVAFDGDESARRRPMRTTIDSLRELGVDVNDDGRGALPFSLYGSGSVEGGALEIDASASSQFVSGLLLSAPRFTHGLQLRHTGEHLPSMPHIEMTVECRRQRGVEVTSPRSGEGIVEPGPIAAAEVAIEPDLSNAAPFLAAAL